MPVPTMRPPAKRRLLRDVVFTMLLNAIVSGELQPEETINEVEVEQWANASRTPVREAIDRLAAIGLVEILPQRGTRVAPVDLRRAAESTSLLGELVTRSLEIVTPTLTNAQTNTILAAAARARRPAGLLQPGGAVDVVVDTVGNPRLRQMVDELPPHILRGWNLRPETEPSMDTLDCAKLTAALQDRDTGRVEAAIRGWLGVIDPIRSEEPTR